MSSETSNSRRSAEPDTDRQAQRARLLLEEKIATLEARIATLEAEQESNRNLKVDFKLQLQDIQDKDALIKELQAATKQDRPISAGDMQGFDALKVAHAQLEEEHEELYTLSRGQVEQLAQLQQSLKILEERNQQLEDHDDILTHQNQQLEDTTKAILRQLDKLLACWI